MTLGTDLMKKLNDGQVRKAPIRQIEESKRVISENCEELIEVGARIRPLLYEKEQIGWVRGVHTQERTMLKRWLKDPNDFVLNYLILATSLSPCEIEEMSAVEVRSLAEVARRMSDYDASLFPYLSAYVTTQSSETLWYGKGERLTSFENRIVNLPDGKSIKIMAPPEHAKTWASLCTYREQAKKRLDQDFNALFIVRPWAGKSADPVSHDLKRIAHQLETDSLDAWEKVTPVDDQPKNDGWAHAGDTAEDLLRELRGMIDGDKHEQLMEVWRKQMEAEAEKQKQALIELRKRRGTVDGGIVEERMEILTDAQMKARQQVLKTGSRIPDRRREEFEVDPRNPRMEKFKRYL